jgi:hypothetical protein
VTKIPILVVDNVEPRSLAVMRHVLGETDWPIVADNRVDALAAVREAAAVDPSRF